MCSIPIETRAISNYYYHQLRKILNGLSTYRTLRVKYLSKGEYPRRSVDISRNFVAS